MYQGALGMARAYSVRGWPHQAVYGYGYWRAGLLGGGRAEWYQDLSYGYAAVELLYL